MVNSGKGRLFRRKDGKFLIYLPKDLAEDSMFPFKGESTFVKVNFKPEKKTLQIEKWTDTQGPELQ
jgi:hypothetical protein